MDLDPRIARLSDAIDSRTAQRVDRAPEHIEAAVTVLLRSRDALEILLVRRAEREIDPWSGHVGLPGGRREPGDADLVQTALRETEEETGVAVDRQGRTLGFLDEVEPAGPDLPPIVVAPLVGVVPADVSLEIDPRELVDATWAPIPALRDPAARDRHLERIGEVEIAFPAIRYEEFLVWGLTHRILTGFLELVGPLEG
ncbi:MAG: CoA pyrophosphatase [Gemmatimonadota bacterium]|nr:CoA pyrophosphatase [Gemmatimonadota bacterium]